MTEVPDGARQTVVETASGLWIEPGGTPEPHEHTCRRCGSGIVCYGDGNNCLGGDNVGCLNEQAEYAAEPRSDFSRWVEHITGENPR